jgi:hypothetical protein
MIFNPKTQQLFASDGTYLKTVHCPHALTPEQLVAIHGTVEGRHCKVCRSTVRRLDEMTDEQVATMLKQSPDTCVFATPAARNIVFLSERKAPPKRDGSMPVIRTLRSLQAIVAAQEQGAKVLIRKTGTPPPEGEFQYEVHQHNVTGKIWYAEDQRQSGPLPFDEFCATTEGMSREEFDQALDRYLLECEEWQVIEKWFSARADQVFPLAGYVIPPGLPEGAEVWVEDVAEDIFDAYWNQGPARRRASGVATWQNGELLFPPPREGATIVG